MGTPNESESQREQGFEGNEYHVPVLFAESLEALQIKPGGIYVDATFGGGGHSRGILSRLGPTGKLVVFDQDAAAQRNVPDDERVLFVPHNFRHLQRFLRLHEIDAVDGILADLGVSSHQFDEAERGFSIRFEGPMDMRMDQRQPLTAAQIVQTYSEQRLQKLFEQYGEVTNARTLARRIVSERAVRPMETIGQFKEAIRSDVKGNPQKYFAQVFQALRMEVNDETGALQALLEQSVNLLKPGGRVAIITFHSIEDRLVKNYFRSGRFQEEEPADLFGNRSRSPLQVITKKPVIPLENEYRSNPRSRSAKLRIAQKL